MPNPNKDKPTLAVGADENIKIDVPVIDEPIKLGEDEFISIAGLASAGRDRLLDALRAHAEKTKAVEHVPPTPTERQKTQTEMEQEAGRRAVQRHTAQAAHRPQPKPDPAEGYTTPAFRPGDHVPGMNSGQLGARNIK